MSENETTGQRYEVGQRIVFAEDPNPFTVEAVSVSGRWVACTREWCQWDIQRAHLNGDDNLYDQDLMDGWPDLGDCVYTVLDLQQGLRGVDNAVGSLGYENREDCQRAISLFESGEFEYSHRSQPIPLNIAEVRRG